MDSIIIFGSNDRVSSDSLLRKFVLRRFVLNPSLPVHF